MKERRCKSLEKLLYVFEKNQEKPRKFRGKSEKSVKSPKKSRKFRGKIRTNKKTQENSRKSKKSKNSSTLFSSALPLGYFTPFISLLLWLSIF